MKISQSLIKEVQKNDHCPKQIYYSFVEGKDLIEPSENMILGRYFETQLLGACRGGEIQEARYLKNGEKAKPFVDCDALVEFAKNVLKNIGLNLENGQSQLDVESELLKGAIDHRNKDIQGKNLANYDVKWTATKEDDRWNGWANVEDKEDAIIQAAHYTLVSYEELGKWLPFYFLVFGRDRWVRIIRFQFTEESIEFHKERISYTVEKIREYSDSNYKGNGTFNKCIACPFHDICPDKKTVAEVESITI